MKNILFLLFTLLASFSFTQTYVDFNMSTAGSTATASDGSKQYQWTVPNGVTSVRVEVWGGGGGATGRINNTTYPGAGGGGGAYARKMSFSVSAGQVLYIQVGRGGAAPTANGSNRTAGNGGQSYVKTISQTGTVIASADGGYGGKVGTTGAINHSASPLIVSGAGSTTYSINSTAPTTNDDYWYGGNGVMGGSANRGGGGGGGAGSGGSGGNGTTGGGSGSAGIATSIFTGSLTGGSGGSCSSNGAGSVGGNYGGGAAGVSSASTSFGNAGASGFVRITYIVIPSNDACANATLLSCGTSNLNGTTVNTAIETPPNSILVSGYGVWYKFIGTGGSTTISTTASSGFDQEMDIFTGTCGSFVTVVTRDASLSNGTETYTFTSTSGVEYYVYVAHWSSAGTSTDTGPFTISLTCCSTPTTAGVLSVSPSNTGTVNDAFTFTTTGNDGNVTKIEWSYNNFTSVAGTTNNPSNPYTLILNVQQPTIWFRTTSISGTCPAGITSPISVNLQSAPPYTYTTSYGDYISNVTLNTINNNSTYDLPLGDGYQDFTSINTDLSQGSTYTLSVSSPVTFANKACGYAAWIDFNNDGVFSVSENIMQKPESPTQTQTFTVPNDASIGLIKMRVLAVYNTQPSTDAYYSIGYGYGEIEEYRVNIQSPLPIELYSFTADCNDGVVSIDWQTASENNSSYFNVLKSRDGSEWQAIGTVEAAGNSTQMISYSLTDKQTGISYYKLDQVDIDGTKTTYGPISVNCEEVGYFSSFPNPSSNSFNIIIEDKKFEGSAKINILDQMGKTILQKNIDIKKGTNLFPIENTDLKPGIYFIIISNDQFKTDIIKQNIK